MPLKLPKILLPLILALVPVSAFCVDIDFQYIFNLYTDLLELPESERIHSLALIIKEYQTEALLLDRKDPAYSENLYKLSVKRILLTEIIQQTLSLQTSKQHFFYELQCLPKLVTLEEYQTKDFIQKALIAPQSLSDMNLPRAIEENPETLRKMQRYLELNKLSVYLYTLAPLMIAALYQWSKWWISKS